MKLYQKVSMLVLCLLACAMIPAASFAQDDDTEECKVAVLPFKSDSCSYRGSNVKPGQIIARILEGRLSKSRYTIMSRTDLSDVRAEQLMNNSDAFSKEGASALGELEGVEYLIGGEVVEFNIEIGKTSSGSFMGFGGSTKKADKAHVSVEASVKDTDSGRIVATVSCRKTFDVGKGSSSANFLFGSSKTKDEGDGSKALNDVCYAIADDLAMQLNTIKFQERAPKLELKGAVVQVEKSSVYINLGYNDKVTKKMVFKVIRPGKNGININIAEIRPVDVSDTYSECQVLNVRDGQTIKPGDKFVTKF